MSILYDKDGDPTAPLVAAGFTFVVTSGTWLVIGVVFLAQKFGMPTPGQVLLFMWAVSGLITVWGTHRAIRARTVRKVVSEIERVHGQ